MRGCHPRHRSEPAAQRIPSLNVHSRGPANLRGLTDWGLKVVAARRLGFRAMGRFKFCSPCSVVVARGPPSPGQLHPVPLRSSRCGCSCRSCRSSSSPSLLGVGRAFSEPRIRKHACSPLGQASRHHLPQQRLRLQQQPLLHPHRPPPRLLRPTCSAASGSPVWVLLPEPAKASWVGPRPTGSIGNREQAVQAQAEPGHLLREGLQLCCQQRQVRRGRLRRRG
jgi:hypothetical protein